MDTGRISTAVPGDISRLDEDAISPQPLAPNSDHSLQHRAVSKSTSSHSVLAQRFSTPAGTAAAFAKFPTEVIQLYVPLLAQSKKSFVLING